MCYSVKMVESGKDFRNFLKLPHEVYKNDRAMVLPLRQEVKRSLDIKHNPYFRNARLKLFLCYKGRKAVSRAAVVMNPAYEKLDGKNCALFGFFESLRDREAAGRLFEAAGSYCRKRGAGLLEGPFNPNHYSEMGIKTNQFTAAPAFFETHNPPYYQGLLKSSGFEVTKELHTRINDNFTEYIRERYGGRQFGTPEGHSVRSFSMKNKKRDLEVIREVFNDAFAGNWYFLPVSREEYLYSSKFLELVTYPGLIKIVEFRGEPAGVVHCVLDVNPLLQPFRGSTGPVKYIRFRAGRKSIDKIIIFAVGIKKAYQGSKVYLMILNEMCKMAEKYKRLGTTWMTDSNRLSVKASESLGLVPDKRFSMFGKTL